MINNHTTITLRYTLVYIPPTPQDHLLARLRFRHLQLIAEIERTGSLSAATAALNVTQPALSKALKEIEDIMGFAVFNRGARGLQVTVQGSVVTRGAKLLLEELRHVHAEALAAGPEGRVSAILRLGAPAYLTSTVVPKIISRLVAGKSLTTVDLHEANVPRLFTAFLEGTLDALITVYNPDVMSETVGHGVQFEKIGEEEYVVIAPAKHPLVRARAITWETLASQSWVLTRKPSLSRLFIEDSFLRHGLMCPPPVCETDSPRTSAQIVAQGVGLSSVPGITAKEAVNSGAARLVRVQTPQPRATLGLVYRTAAARHPRIKLLREAVSQVSGLGLPIAW